MPLANASPRKSAKAERSQAKKSAKGAFVRAERERAKKCPPITSVGRERFRCDLWSCDVSRYACASRWTQSQERQPRGSAYDLRSSESPFARCSKCAVGRENAALIPAESLARRKAER